MTLQVSADIAGREMAPEDRLITADETMCFAAGVGEENPRYFDDTVKAGIVAPPLFAVAVTWPVIRKFQERLSREISPPVLNTSVHASEWLKFHRLLRPGDRLRIGARIAALFPTAAGAHMVLKLEAIDTGGRPAFTEYCGALFRGVRCAGAARQLEEIPGAGPAAEDLESTSWEAELPVARQAAHVYSACAGIFFPIHTSPAFAHLMGLPGIILHGTATLALAAREIIQRELAGEPERLAEIGCRFTGMVIPGTSIRVQAGAGERAVDGGEMDRLSFRVLNHQGRPALRGAAAIRRRRD